jgi:hypothetical protein
VPPKQPQRRARAGKARLTTTPDTSTPGRVRAGRARIVAGTILAAVVLVQWTGCDRPFFADDFLFLEQVRGRSLAQALAAPDPIGNFLRPVSRPLYFWVLSRAGGGSPLPFHAANLALFLAALAVLFALVRRLLGTAAAATAIAFAGLHYAADVPLRWASGSQDLLALLFATLAAWWFSGGRAAAAAGALALALLSKEVAAGAVVVAWAAAWAAPGSRRPGRAGGALLAAVTLAWAAAWFLTRGQRPSSSALSFDPSQAAAAVAHLFQVAAGFEPRLDGAWPGPWNARVLAPALFAALVVAWAGLREPRPAAAAPPQRVLVLGLAWCVAAVVPLVPVMHFWSAYFYLWAVFGVAVVLAAATAGMTHGRRAVVVAVLVAASAGSRGLDEFALAGGPWSWQSHVNRHYLDRATAAQARYLAQLRAAHPTLPPRSTVFFAQVPVRSGWQAADGPLLRHEYGDSTLRSYFLTQFTRERAGRGPVYFLVFEGDSLRDRTGHPALLQSFAYSMLLSEQPAAARDALALALTRAGESRELRYWLAWARWASGDTLGARADLAAAGVRPARELPEGGSEEPLAADTTAGIDRWLEARDQAGLHPWAHARLAARGLAGGENPAAAIEALAYRLLRPDEPDAWRKWASAQLAAGQLEPALRSLERYFHLAGAGGAGDDEARRVAAELRRRLRGDLARAGLRDGPP